MLWTGAPLWHCGPRVKNPLEGERFLRCPKCQAVAATADTLGRSVVYVRCTACGETWTISERRKTPRTTERKPRFPADPHDG